MKIEIDVRDSTGNQLEIGDLVEMFDWGDNRRSLGVVKIIWDVDDGRVSCEPMVVEDAYDFWTKALPMCRKLNVGKVAGDVD